MTTKLELHNATDTDVTAYITLGATSGCVQDVALVTLSDGQSINKLFPLMGTINLAAKKTIELTAPVGMGFNGNFSFNTPPLNCPTPEFQFGVNLAEFIINNWFQPNGQETVDNSCVAGANAFIRFELSADDWTTNGGTITVKSFMNTVWSQNTGLIGVYPYGCDNCTASVSPPSCVGQQPQFVNKEPICNVQRSALSNQGGTVRVVFNGMTPVAL
jgi:hypothetical protein